MTREETIQFLVIIKAAYPNYKPQSKEATIEIWSSMLADVPTEMAAAALKVFIKTDESGFAPSIGQLLGCIRKLQKTQQGEELTEIEAWNIVSKAVRNSGYRAKEEFDQLPPLLKRLVGSPATLRTWGMIPSEEFHTVVQSNFLRSYRALCEQEQERTIIADALAQIEQKAQLKLNFSKIAIESP